MVSRSFARAKQEANGSRGILAQGVKADCRGQKRKTVAADKRKKRNDMAKMVKSYPNVREDVSIQDLLESGLHFGHRTKRWNPKMRKYLFGQKNGIYIIDLEQTLAGLQEARQFLYDTVARGRQVLFVGTKKQAQAAIRELAEKYKQPYVVTRWLGGTLTNIATVKKSIARMAAIAKMEEDKSLEKLPKKEVISAATVLFILPVLPSRVRMNFGSCPI